MSFAVHFPLVIHCHWPHHNEKVFCEFPSDQPMLWQLNCEFCRDGRLEDYTSLSGVHIFIIQFLYFILVFVWFLSFIYLIYQFSKITQVFQMVSITIFTMQYGDWIWIQMIIIIFQRSWRGNLFWKICCWILPLELRYKVPFKFLAAFVDLVSIN